MKKNSIRQTLFAFASRTILITLVSINIVTVVWIVISQQKQAEQIRERTHHALLSKGTTLVINNSRALRQLAEDNAFVAIRELVAMTVRDDGDVVQGVYMDAERQAWVNARLDNPDGHLLGAVTLDDSISLWASNLTSVGYRDIGTETIEIAGPVMSDGEKLGTIRYSLSTALVASLASEALSRNLQNGVTLIAVFLCISVIIFLATYKSARRQASAITRPLHDLTLAATRIAEGDYKFPIQATTEDEIGDLAQSFEIMRRTVKEYTDNLESMVAQRTTALEEAMKELERSNKELEQFAYVASHDLREPLRMVSSYTQLLAKRYKEKLDQDAMDFISFAVDGSNRMQGLIDDLLKYSRVGTKGKPFAETNCETVYEIVTKNLEVAIQDHDATVSKDPLPSIMADETQLIQLLQNLIANALKFCKDRKPEVHIAAQEETDQWEFTVRDNGIGIAPENIDRIFQIFQRLHTREEYEGTGIGLAVCKRIVERHGGAIWVESEVDVGTVFHFTIRKRNQVASETEAAESSQP